MGRLDTTQPGGRYLVGGKLVDANGKALKEQPAAETTGDLPEDFPGRDELVAGGFSTLGAVKAASDEDLDAVPGIGPATLKEIRAAQK